MNVLLAPNGKPSNLTSEQYKLVRTLEFKAWFGDWENDPANASKVVDENGEPLVVYHGTEKKSNFIKFAPISYFTENYSYAKVFALGLNFSDEMDDDEYDRILQEGGENVYSVFLSLKNPKKTERTSFNSLLQDSEFVLESKKEGYDGLLNIIKTSYLPFRKETETQFVSFEPNQIKLADGTNTTFDGSNPYIRFTKGGKVIVLPADLQKYKKIGVEDKYFIEASKDVGLQGINFDVKSISKKITDEFTNLLNNYENYLINVDSQSITSYIKNEIETKKELGASLDEINNLEESIENQNSRNKIIFDIAQTQKSTVIQWVDYLKESNYPIDFKYLILKAILTFNYDLKQNKLYERGNDTIRNFTPFDAGSLSELFTNQSEFLLRDYSILMNENSAKVLNSQEVIEKSSDGKWIKFKGGRNTKGEDIEKNGKELMKLVQNTYWCTKSEGTSQLRGGDFYVYVTENNGEIFPRIAVRMNENEVGELRGNSSSAQDLDAEMLPIAESFLTKNIPNDSGKRWLNSIKYNKKCVALRKKIEAEGLYKNFIYDYIEVLADKDKYRVDYGENGNVTMLVNTFERLKDNLPNEYYSKSDIESQYQNLNKDTLYFIGSLDKSQILSINGFSDLKNWKLKVVSKSLNCSDTINDLGNIEYIGENLILSSNTNNLGKVKFIGNTLEMGNSNIDSLNQLEYIGQGFTVNAKIKDLGKLKKVGSLEIVSCAENFTLGELEEVEGDLIIKVSDKKIDFGKLKNIGGNFIANKTLITELNELESVGKDFQINGSKIKIFSKLKTIGGDADFSNNFTSSTQNIETILGSVKFLNSRIMEFNKLKKIGGSIEFKGSFFKSLGSIEYLGGNINLADSKLEDLGNLEYLGGYMSFKGSKIVFLKKLKKIVGFANFDMSLVEDLGDLESIGGNGYFNQTKIKSIGKLNYIGGFAQFQGNKNLEEQWLKKNK